MLLQEILSVLMEYFILIQEFNNSFGGFDEGFIQALITGTAGLFIFVSINLSSIMRLLDRFYGDGRHSVMPLNAIISTQKIIGWLFVAFLCEITLFFVDGIFSVLLFGLAMYMLLKTIDSSLGIVNLVYEEVENIASEHDLGNNFLESSWEQFHDETEEDLSNYTAVERELIAYEHLYPYDKEEKIKNRVRPYERITYFVYFLTSKYEKYENGVPLDWLISAISTSQAFNSHSKDEIEEKTLEAIKYDFLDLLEGDVDPKVKITQGESREEVLERMEYLENRNRLDAEAISKSLELMEEEGVPPTPPLQPSYFLQPIYGLKTLLKHIYYKLKGGKYLEKSKKHHQEYRNKLEKLRSSNQEDNNT